MKKSELRKIIKEEILKENSPGFDVRKSGEALPTLDSVKAAYEANINENWLGQEQIDRFEGTANMRDLKTLQDMLRMVGSEWMQEGFEKEDIKEYINYYIDQI